MNTQSQGPSVEVNAEDKDPKAPSFSRILVPIDFSPESKNLLNYAIYLGNTFKSHLRLIHIIDTSFYGAEVAYVQLEIPKLREDVFNRLQRICREDLAGLKSDYAVLEGSPFHEIAEAAKEFAAGMIVMGSHGYTGLKRVLLGSTAERVVRHSPCPVLVVRTSLKDAHPH